MVRFVPQPRLEAMGLTVRLRLRGWRLKQGTQTLTFPLDRTVRLSWHLGK